ncbi:hypothetical protein SLS55_009996 [Diplodia seriata]|uniref:Uncharacterized protein n=1 Tax=Diplodia seriata TaxID=420778 RepID=A0ABR3C304_9PEZI
MATMNAETRAISWLQLVNHPSTENIARAVAKQVPHDEILAPLAALLQCRLDVMSITERLEKADSWAALNSSQTQFSQVRTRFRTSMKGMSGGALAGSLRIKAGDVPFGKVQWESAYTGSSTSADSDGDRTMTDESEDDSIGEQSDEEDEDDYESDSDGGGDDGRDESLQKPGCSRSDEAR